MNSVYTMWGKTKQVTSVIRLKPFDISTPAGRSRERQRRVALTALASAGAKGVAVLTSLISVPLTLNYLGVERYGLWMTISSLTALLNFADLGMGNGLLNAISEANGKNDRSMAREYVSSGFFLLFSVAMALAVFFAIVYPWLDWASIFNVTSTQAVAESGRAVAIFIGYFLINVPLGVVQRVQLGYQEGFVNSLWQALGSLLGLTGLLLAINLHVDLPWLIVTIMGGPVLATLCQNIVIFGFSYPQLRPRWPHITRSATRKIFRLGFLFFILQIAVAMAFASDNLVAAQILGPQAVAEYAIAVRLFSIPTIVLSMLFTPLWPAYGEAIVRGDIVWVKRTLLRSLLLALIGASSASVIFVLFGGQIIVLWAGTAVAPSFGLLLGLGIWTVLSATGNAAAMFLNGAGMIKFEVISSILMSISALIAKIMLARMIGVPGIVWGTILAYIIFSGIPHIVYISRLLVKMHLAST
jgi:O-antigen/teichoic acid export membrane protein